MHIRIKQTARGDGRLLMIRERRGERRGTGRQTQRNVKGNQMWKKKKKKYVHNATFFKKLTGARLYL